MTLHRIKPDFDTKSARGSVTGGFFLALVSLVLGLAFVIGLFVTGIKNRHLWAVLMGLFLAPVLVFQGGMGIKMALDGVSTLTQRNRWISGAERNHARVLEKKEDSFDASYDEGRCYRYELALDLGPLMAVDSSSEQFVWTSVSKGIYDRYAIGDITPVYYLATSPLTFMIDGE
jgi:hypothetical protein